MNTFSFLFFGFSLYVYRSEWRQRSTFSLNSRFSNLIFWMFTFSMNVLLEFYRMVSFRSHNLFNDSRPNLSPHIVRAIVVYEVWNVLSVFWATSNATAFSRSICFFFLFYWKFSNFNDGHLPWILVSNIHYAFR